MRRLRLLEWALGTFHTIVFMLTAVVLLYSQGALGGLLSGLSTLAGLALFAALWTTTMFASVRALRGIEGLGGAQDPQLLRGALRWGAANGVLFLGMVALGVIVAASATGRLGPTLAGFVFVGPFAVVVAAAVGATIGTLLGIIDLVLIAFARGVVATGS